MEILEKYCFGIGYNYRISLPDIMDYTVYERITLNWSARSHIAWNHSSKCFKYICSSDQFYKTLGDISILSKSRALAEYGLMVNKTFGSFQLQNNFECKFFQIIVIIRQNSFRIF